MPDNPSSAGWSRHIRHTPGTSRGTSAHPARAYHGLWTGLRGAGQSLQRPSQEEKDAWITVLKEQHARAIAMADMYGSKVALFRVVQDCPDFCVTDHGVKQETGHRT